MVEFPIETSFIGFIVYSPKPCPMDFRGDFLAFFLLASDAQEIVDYNKEDLGFFADPQHQHGGVSIKWGYP